MTALGRAALLAAIAATAQVPASDLAAAPQVAEARLEPLELSSLDGFADDDLSAALAAFRRSCGAPGPQPPQLASVAGSAEDLARACAEASRVDPQAARRFFLTTFSAFRVSPPEGRRRGLLTGYFEPELSGSLRRSEVFATPVLARPDDLVSFAPGESRPGLDPALRAARLVADRYEPYPDRAAIEDGVLENHTAPVLWLKDPVDLLVLQIQGSGRVTLPDGRKVRVLYDGKNGRPFTGVPRLIVEGGHLPLEGLTLERWTSWLRANPGLARDLMRRNASYVFFRVDATMDMSLGPLGASGVPLTPGRSLAVDGSLWRYGLPFWLDGTLRDKPSAKGRMVVAQDTGSAILGPARGDLYVGTGAQAGRVAGNFRDEIGFVVLLPRPASRAMSETP